jgi:Pyruvate/2-oxoacid:ferredoxin oxidoreductase delta subunit
MGLKPEDIPTNKEASRRKIGNTELNNIRLVGQDIRIFLNKRFLLPKPAISVRVPKIFLHVFSSFIKLRPHLDNKICKQCFMCIKHCPKMAIYKQKNLLKINYALCIDCFCCQEVCFWGAIKIKESFFLKVIHFFNKLLKR